MAYSKITITFLQVPEVGYTLGFNETFLNFAFHEIFKVNRLASFQTKIPSSFDAGFEEESILIYSGFCAYNLKSAFNLDYNSNDLFTVTALNDVPNQGKGTVIIEANYSGANFLYIDDETGNVAIKIDNEPPVDPFVITDISVSQSINPCTHVAVAVTTSELATLVLSPILIDENLDNPIIFECLRGSTVFFQFENVNGNLVSQSIVIPALLNAANFELQINNSPFGASVLVNSSNSDQLILQYSLDNDSWQNSNEFSGLEVGDYDLYIRDQFGCSTSKAFNVDEFGVQLPYFYISKSNSFRFANRITWGDSENYKNDENTLSCEVDVLVPYKEVQRFQSADIITTQFKSNYSSNIATVIREDGTTVNIPILKKTSNIGIKDKRDARRYKISDGKNGIYFLSGNVYNYDSNVITDPYILNGLLPEWAQIGNYFSIGTYFYLIEDIVYDEEKNADVIVFANSYSGSELDLIVGSIYNRFNYEVYEFTIDMVNYINEKFKVKLENSNVNLTTITHLSEVIFCKVKHENVLEIRYRNTTNTDILYSTGIEHKIRIPYTKISGKSDGDSETHKTDSDAILLNADLYEADEFLFEPVTKEIWRKIMIALSHEKVLINGVGYVKNDGFDTEGPLERSNLYVLTATMIKTGNVYNSQTSGNLDFDGSEVEVPGLISTESGFISY